MPHSTIAIACYCLLVFVIVLINYIVFERGKTTNQIKNLIDENNYLYEKAFGKLPENKITTVCNHTCDESFIPICELCDYINESKN